MATTALAIVNGALELIGVKAQGETLSAAEAMDGLRRLNLFVGTLANSTLSQPFVVRQVFDLVADQATYTMGPGGDFNVPIRPTVLTGAGLILTSSTPDVEIPRAIVTQPAYQALRVKGLTSTLFTVVYFEPTYAGDLATVTLWPTPTTADNDLVLYWPQAIAGFTDLTTSYVLPTGYAELFEAGLAVRVAPAYGTAAADDVKAQARESLGAVKRTNANQQISDLQMDPGLTGTRAGGYDIYTG